MKLFLRVLSLALPALLVSCSTAPQQGFYASDSLPDVFLNLTTEPALDAWAIENSIPGPVRSIASPAVIPETPAFVSDLELSEDVKLLQDYLPKLLQFRAQTIAMYEVLHYKTSNDIPLDGDDTEYLLQQKQLRSDFRDFLQGLIRRYSPAAKTYSMELVRKQGRSWLFRRAAVLLAARMLLDDGFLLSTTMYQKDSRLRRLLNEPDSAMSIERNELKKEVKDFYHKQTVQLRNAAYDVYGICRAAATAADDPESDFLDLVIRESVAFQVHRELYDGATTHDRVEFFMQRTFSRAEGLSDHLWKLRHKFVFAISQAFGWTIGSFQWKKGKLLGNPDLTEWMEQHLQPLDVLFDKTRYRVSQRLIPGFWGHNALWIGSEKQLRELGLWDHPAIQPLQERITQGRSIVEGLRFGVVMNRIPDFLNIDDIAATRAQNMTPEQQKAGILALAAQVGKAYDFEMSAESTEKLFCTEVIFRVFHWTDFNTKKIAGRWTVLPDAVAWKAIGPDAVFTPVMFWYDGVRLDSRLEMHFKNTLERKVTMPEFPADLPEKVSLKTRTETFTHEYYFAVRAGKVWFKPNLETTGRAGYWQVVGQNGLPDRDVAAVKEISADGANLIAVSESGQVYYAKTHNWKWMPKWGMPIRKPLTLPPGNRSWSISHRGSYMPAYKDIDGNPHPVSAGVTTLYVLMENGHEIRYADPWLPAGFHHQVDTPEKGRFIASAMSASGSTLFIMGPGGEMYTRLFDYDTSGENPVLPYTYEHGVRKGTDGAIRTLPNEPWVKQPSIPPMGMFISRITILQTDSEFELRVEGINGQGKTGYYTKAIAGDAWTFVEDGHQIWGKLQAPGAQAGSSTDSVPVVLGPRKTVYYSGTLGRNGEKESLKAELLDFSLISTPAVLRLEIGGETYDLRFHTRRHKLISETGHKFHGTLEVPDELIRSSDSKARKAWDRLFRRDKYIDLHITIEGGEFEAKEDLHILGIDRVADLYYFKVYNKLSRGNLHPQFHRRLMLKLKLK